MHDGADSTVVVSRVENMLFVSIEYIRSPLSLFPPVGAVSH